MIIFRCDASASIGIGHLVRCISLARLFAKQGWPMAIMAPVEEFKHIIPKDLFVETIDEAFSDDVEHDAEKLIKFGNRLGASFYVLDDYRIDDSYQKIMRDNNKKWLQFDGFINKSIWADIVLNTTLTSQEKDYKKLLKNSQSRLLLGPEYLILREEFYSLKAQKNSQVESSKLLVTFGGGDDRGAILECLKTLAKFESKYKEIVVVSGLNNPCNEKNKDWIASSKLSNISYLINPENTSSIYQECSAAICSGGTTAYELAYLDKPMIIVSMADNQIPQGLMWGKIGKAFYIGDYSTINTQLNKFLIDKLVEQKNSPSLGISTKINVIVEAVQKFM